MIKIRKYLFVLFLTISSNIIAQDDSFPDFTKVGKAKNKEIEQLEKNYLNFVDSASIAICAKDTSLAIQYLIKYVNCPSHNIFKEIAGYKVGALYLEINKKDLAKKAFISLLISNKESEFYSLGNIKGCRFILDGFDNVGQSGYRYNACIKLYECATEEQNYVEAFKYLKFAEEKYPANFACGNAYYLYKGQLNLKFANYYLSIKDTTKAIGKLFNCILDKEGYPKKAMQTLSHILYTKYTNKQIVMEIDKGISGLRKVKYSKSNEENIQTEIDLFGNTIIWQQGYNDPLEKLKERLKSDICINDLKKAKYIPPQYLKN